MLLLVGLANIIMDRARQAEAGVNGGTSQVEGQPKAKSDPLADIGAVPSPETTQSTAKADPAPN